MCCYVIVVVSLVEIRRLFSRMSFTILFRCTFRLSRHIDENCPQRSNSNVNAIQQQSTQQYSTGKWARAHRVIISYGHTTCVLDTIRSQTTCSVVPILLIVYRKRLTGNLWAKIVNLCVVT